jgi:hypothetical protein
LFSALAKAPVPLDHAHDLTVSLNPRVQLTDCLDVVEGAVRPGEDRLGSWVYVLSMGSDEGGTERRPAQRGSVPDPIILEFRFRPPESSKGSLAEDAEHSDVTSAELARQLNASIYKAGLSLADQREQEFQLTFFCACGCMAEVKRSLQDYVTRGAVVAGHMRPSEVHR